MQVMRRPHGCRPVRVCPRRRAPNGQIAVLALKALAGHWRFAYPADGAKTTIETAKTNNPAARMITPRSFRRMAPARNMLALSWTSGRGCAGQALRRRRAKNGTLSGAAKAIGRPRQLARRPRVACAQGRAGFGDAAAIRALKEMGDRRRGFRHPDRAVPFHHDMAVLADRRLQILNRSFQVVRHAIRLPQMKGAVYKLRTSFIG